MSGDDGASTAEEPRGTAGLLRDRTFGPYFFGNFVSNSGNFVQNVAAAVVVYQLTGSAVMVGAVTVMLWLPSLLLQPWAGALSDRVNRRYMLVWGQGVAAVSAAVLALWTAAVGAQGLPGPWPSDEGRPPGGGSRGPALRAWRTHGADPVAGRGCFELRYRASQHADAADRGAARRG